MRVILVRHKVYAVLPCAPFVAGFCNAFPITAMCVTFLCLIENRHNGLVTAVIQEKILTSSQKFSYSDQN